MPARRQHSRRARVAGLALAAVAFAGGAVLPFGTFEPTSATAAGSTTQTGQAEPTDTSGAACPASNPPNELLLAAGTPQTAQLNTAFSSALQVTLANTDGCPVTAAAGTPVTFTAPASGASASFAASGSSTLTVGADSSGNASAGTFTANDTPGSYTITAQTTYGSTSFSVTNTAAGIPAMLTAVSATAQQAIAGSPYTDPLSVRIADADGHPISGITVTFTLGSGAGGAADGGSTGSGESAGATFPGGGSTATAQTNSDGVANSPMFAANQSAGTFFAFATVPQLSQPATFRLLNLPAPGERLTRLGSGHPTATVGEPYRDRLRVRLRHAGGSPVIGATVTFTLGTTSDNLGSSVSGSPSAAASFTNGTDTATVTTGRSGIAVSPPLTANGVVGSSTAVATSPATNSVARFSLTNRPGRGARLTILGTRLRTAVVAQRYARALAVRVLDASRRPLIGASVTFSLSAGPSSASGGAQATSAAGTASASFPGAGVQATVTTNIDGIAVSPPLTANTVAGRFVATGSVAAVNSIATFQLENHPGAPASVIAGAGARQASPIGTRFQVPLAVTVLDVFANPVPGALVTFTAPPAAASGSFDGHRSVSVRTDRRGIAAAPPLTATQVPGGYIVTATAGRVRAAFALVNQAP